MAKSQHELIIEHFRSGRSLSQMEALGVYKIQRLASRIDELRQMGWPIVTKMKIDPAGSRYARYSCVTDGMQLPERYLPAHLQKVA